MFLARACGLADGFDDCERAHRVLDRNQRLLTPRDHGEEMPELLDKRIVSREFDGVTR